MVTEPRTTEIPHRRSQEYGRELHLFSLPFVKEMRSQMLQSKFYELEDHHSNSHVARLGSCSLSDFIVLVVRYLSGLVAVVRCPPARLRQGWQRIASNRFAGCRGESQGLNSRVLARQAM